MALQEAGERRQGAQQLAADVARRVQAGELSRADQLQADALGAAALADEALAAARAAASGEALRALLGLSADEPRRGPRARGRARARHADGRASHPAPPVAAPAARAGVARGAAALGAHADPRAPRADPAAEPRARRPRCAPQRQRADRPALPLGAGASQQAALAQTAAERIEAEQGLAREQERLAALHAVRARRCRRRAVPRHRSLQAAVETREVLERSFRLGETDLPTRLRVEQEARSAIAERERARLDLHLAIAQLRHAGPAAAMKKDL